MYAVYTPTGADVYYRFYKSQTGSGYAHPGIDIYRGPIYQRGNGLGSIFSSFARWLTPLFTSNAVKSIGRQLLAGGVNLGGDILGGETFGNSLVKRGRESGSEILNQVASTLRNQTGSGRRRKRRRTTTTATAGRRRKRRRVTKTSTNATGLKRRRRRRGRPTTVKGRRRRRTTLKKTFGRKQRVGGRRRKPTGRRRKRRAIGASSFNGIFG